MTADRKDVLRSDAWFAPRDVAGLIHRSYMRSQGFSADGLAGRPIIGVCNSWSELVNCNVHLRGLANAVKRGVLQAGGLPLEFPTMSLGEPFMKPTTMLYRNLMAMEVEETIRANPLDAVVLLAGCDKTVPAQLMGAASAGIPAIMITGGPMATGCFRGEAVTSGSSLWKYTDDFRAGHIDANDYAELELAITPSNGHCMEMGTASTMASLVEALGMSLPGTAAIPATHARRAVAAELTGRHAVRLARQGPEPRRVLTPSAFKNAVAVLMAIGGSTNAVVHLIALAGRVGVDLPLEQFDTASRNTPRIVNVRPTGEHLFEDLDRAGGIPAVMRALGDLVDTDALTVTGGLVRENLEDAEVRDRTVILPVDRALDAQGGLAVLRGTLAPRGALLKPAGMSPDLKRHRGPAVIFDDLTDMLERLEDPGLRVTQHSVLVLRGTGPTSRYGMPEWGQIPIPQRLLKDGVRDLLRISDARISGTATGSMIVHVAPDSGAPSPLRALRDGDIIDFDLNARRLDVEISDGELAERLARACATESPSSRGYLALYQAHVLQADEGCDFDFLRGGSEAGSSTLPLGVSTGWLTGW